MADTSAYWTEAHARRLLEEWKKSGLSLSAFARREGLRSRRLQWWKERLGTDRASAAKGAASRSGETEAPKFAPAVVKRAPRVTLARSMAAVVITTRSGRTLEIADATRVPPSWIGQVVRELERVR